MKKRSVLLMTMFVFLWSILPEISMANPSSNLSTISLAGVVKDRVNASVAGVLVEVDGSPTLFNVTDENGFFVVSGIPQAALFRLKITKVGYLPVYTQYYSSSQSFDNSNYPYYLFTPDELELLPGRSAVIVGVVDSNSGSLLSGVSASTNVATTQIMYVDAASHNIVPGTETDLSGVFVAIVPSAHEVTLSGMKYGYFMNSLTTTVPNGSIIEAVLPLSLRPTYSLTLQQTGSGNGFLSSSPGGTCTEPSCTISIVANLGSTITAVPSDNSSFGGWVDSNCSGQSNPCDIWMSDNKTVIASFSLQPFKIEGAARYFSSLAEAFSAVQNYETIFAQKSYTPTGTTFNRPNVLATLKGGFNDSFNSSTREVNDFTLIDDTLVVSHGTLVVDQIIIK
ncbi:hypothetical protein SAMN02745119_01261 [Trichlorobacter thiogenes]|uniref:Carboxypeptidase regulatory-like domain-containing protein n=1 Tax=Trichlorobacter thiogenes TaxID=115783 RepID=A0A1T4MER5_9BACT|nr:carboxypeptidase-like regulatory domain-containing protein [Trichlorobacter thiogenes]SJZ65381.1 hypothetical protein SAMN02745119_01261 [Trichlorobacter thiogenes]